MEIIFQNQEMLTEIFSVQAAFLPDAPTPLSLMLDLDVRFKL